MEKILILEDCILASENYRDALGQHYQLNFCSTLKEAFRLLQKHDYQLLLIDIGLPDGEGFDLVTQLRDRNNLPPYVFVSGRIDIEDKLKAFALGAEDYIYKPFDSRELLARVQVRLKAIQPPAGAHYSNGLRIELSQLKAFLDHDGISEDLLLTPNEFKVLRAFLSTPDTVLSRSDILLSGWGKHIKVLDRTVDKHISTLRKKLASSPFQIESITGSGYRWRSLKNEKTN